MPQSCTERLSANLQYGEWRQKYVPRWRPHLHAWSGRIGCPYVALFHCMVRHCTVQYGSLLGGFPLGTVLGTFFSSTSAEVPSEPYRYQNVTCKLCWSLIGRRKSPLPFVVCWGSTDVPLVDSRGADPARAWWSDAELKRFSGVTAVEAVQL